MKILRANARRVVRRGPFQIRRMRPSLVLGPKADPAFDDVCAHARAPGDCDSGLRDADTADLFTGVSRQLDKGLWLLDAHLHVDDGLIN
jgi:hypothetical protein